MSFPSPQVEASVRTLHDQVDQAVSAWPVEAQYCVGGPLRRAVVEVAESDEAAGALFRMRVWLGIAYRRGLIDAKQLRSLFAVAAAVVGARSEDQARPSGTNRARSHSPSSAALASL